MYSKPDIVTAIKNSRVLDKKVAHFCGHYYKIPKNKIYADEDLDYSNYKGSFWHTFNLLKAQQSAFKTLS